MNDTLTNAEKMDVARDTSTPVELLTLLAGDNEGGVRWVVANNPSTPVELLTLLADDDKAGVHLAAWRTAFRLLSDADRVTFNALRADGWTGTVAELLSAVRLLAG